MGAHRSRRFRARCGMLGALALIGMLAACQASPAASADPSASLLPGGQGGTPSRAPGAPTLPPGDLVGTITWTQHTDTFGEGTNVSDDQVTLYVQFNEQDGKWVDAGSSYTWTGSASLDYDPGDDPENGYCNAHHRTSTITGGEAFAESLVSTISVDVDRGSKQVAVESWVAGFLQTHDLAGTPYSGGGDTVSCILKETNSSQGGGTTVDSQAEWGQVPRCMNGDESVVGTISDDGRTATFACSDTQTHELSAGMSNVVTMTVSGQLTFAAAQ